MILSFLSPTARVPIGGVTVITELANVMAARGHEVHVLHVRFEPEESVFTYPSSPDDISDKYHPDVVHHFYGAGANDDSPLPDADVFFGYGEISDRNPSMGHPVQLVQGWEMLDREIEVATYRSPCPKMCVARWLIDVGVDLGVPSSELLHLPIALHHDRFRIDRAIAERRPALAFLYNQHPRKGMPTMLAALEKVRAELSDVSVSCFGSRRPDIPLPDWIEFERDPEPDRIVELYNDSAVFLCTSIVEGFGLANLEAMACGAALVTTDNGGSSEYAEHDSTAIVAPVDDADAIARGAIDLLRDRSRRTRIATAGSERARTFTWDRSARILEGHLERYVADPAAMGRPV